MCFSILNVFAQIGDLGSYLGLEDNEAGEKAEAAGWTWDKKVGRLKSFENISVDTNPRNYILTCFRLGWFLLFW